MLSSKMRSRAAYEPSLFSAETSRTAPPPYETSSLFNANAPVPPQYCDTALALPVESPRHSVLTSSPFHNEGLHVSSSQLETIEEVTTPPAQPELERHESGMAPRRFIQKLIQRAFSPSDLSHPLQSPDGLVAQTSQIQRSRSARAPHLDNRTNFTKPGENIGRHEPPAPPSAPMTQRAQSSTTVLTPPPSASVPSTPTRSRPRSPTHSSHQPTHTEESSSTPRPRTRAMPRNLERPPPLARMRPRALTPSERRDSVPRMPNPGERVMLDWAMNPQ